MDQSKPESRSPLKAKPLHYPGQSLDEEIAEVFDDHVGFWIMYAGVAVMFAILEWVRWTVNGQFHPVTMSLAVACIVALATWKVRRAQKRLRALKLGRDGERLVAEYLDGLREKGCRVFHDLVGDGFNVDHVIICQHGIFTIDTKTYSKPKGKEVTVRVKEGRITVNGHEPDRDLLEQAKAQAKWVNTILRESTGKMFAVKPVIVFPGWYVEPVSKEDARGVWVLNPKALPTFIGNEPAVLPQQDAMLATYHLSRHIRSAN